MWYQSDGQANRAALLRGISAQAADTRDWAALADCFTSDAVMVMPGLEVVGGQAIADALRGMLPEGFITKHLIVNPQVEWRGPGRAQVRAVVYYAHEGAGFEAVGWGDYTDDEAVALLRHGRDRGITWSSVSSLVGQCLPQYWQRLTSRA